jgi:Cdc6-like AAA superfamily ATPase
MKVKTDTDIDTWVAALAESLTIQNRDTREEVIAELPKNIRNTLNTNLPNLNTQLRNLVKTCQNYPDGLTALVEAIRKLEGDSLIVRRLIALLAPTLSPDYISRQYSLPPATSPIFGREADIERIQAFALASANRRPVLIIHGPSGIGKTTTVLRALNDLDPAVKNRCVYLQIEGETNLLQTITNRLGLSPYQTYRGIATDIQEKQIILVIDSADAVPASELVDLANNMEPESQSKLIIIRQQPLTAVSGRDLEQVPLSYLGINESKAGFRHYLGTNLQLSATQEVNLEIICELLDGHPLALAVTGGLTDAHGLPRLRQEVERLFKRAAELSSDNPLQVYDDHGNELEKSPWIALEIAFERLKKSRNAYALICQLSLWPGDIDDKAFDFITEINPSFAITSLRKVLIDRQLLVNKGNGIYSLHSLVRIYARYYLRQLPESAAVHKNIGKYLVNQNRTVNVDWIAGVNYLLESGAWLDIIQQFQIHYRILDNFPPLQIAETYPEILPALAHYCLAWIYDEKRQTNEALERAAEVKSCLENIPELAYRWALQIRAHTLITNNKLRQFKLDEAGVELEVTNALLLNLEEEPFQWEIGQVRLGEGIFYRWMERHQDAIHALETAKAIYEAVGDPLQLLKVESNLATPFSDAGRIQESIAMSHIVLNKTTPPQPYEWAKIRAAEKSNLVDSLTLMGQFANAISLAEEAAQECTAQGFDGEWLALMINMAKAENKISALDSARQRLQASLKLLTELGHDDYRAETLAVLAENNLYAGNLKIAQQQIMEAFESDEIYGPYRQEALRVKAQIQLALNNQEGAVEILSTSIGEAREKNYLYHEARSALELARAYAQMGEVESAFTHLTAAEEYFDQSEIVYYYDQAQQLRAELSA